MERTSDWFSVPAQSEEQVKALALQESGGLWAVREGLRVHRSLLARLPEELTRSFLPWSITTVDDLIEVNLRPYQQTAARFARQREGSLLALGCGLGKTRTSLYASHVSGGSVRGVVIAPKVTFPVWKKEIRLVYGPYLPITFVRGRALSDDPDELRGAGICILNPEILKNRWSEWLGGPRLDFVILDEAHIYSRGTSKRTGAAHALANLADQRIALTGTPILRHPMDLHSIIGAVAPGALGSWPTLANWLNVHRNRYGYDLHYGLKPDAVARFEFRLAELMLRQRWEEVSDQVPPIQREVVRVELTAAERKCYDEAANDIRVVLGDRVSLAKLRAASGLVQVTRLRKLVGVAKVRAVVDLVASMSAPVCTGAKALGEPVVIWTWHRDIAGLIASRLIKEQKLRVVCVTGEHKDKDRQAAISAFQRGDVDVFVGTLAIASVGIDLTRSRIAINAELSYTPADHAQAEARTWRTGQKNACITYWITAAGTVEDRAVEILTFKASQAREGAVSSALAGVAEQTAADALDLNLDRMLDRALALEESQKV